MVRCEKALGGRTARAPREIDTLAIRRLWAPAEHPLIGLEGRPFGRRDRRRRGDPESQHERSTLPALVGRSIRSRRFVLVMIVVAVVVLAEVDVEVEEPHARASVAVPIKGRVRAETQGCQDDQRRQQRTEPPHTTSEGNSQPSQHEHRLYPGQAA